MKNVRDIPYTKCDNMKTNARIFHCHLSNSTNSSVHILECGCQWIWLIDIPWFFQRFYWIYHIQTKQGNSLKFRTVSLFFSKWIMTPGFIAKFTCVLFIHLSFSPYLTKHHAYVWEHIGIYLWYSLE